MALHARIVLLGGMLGLCLACQGGSNPNPNDLPQVGLSVADTNAVGDHLDLTVSVSGCNQVTQTVIQNSGSALKTFTYTTTPTKVQLGVSDIPWPAVGIGGVLTLSAEVTCDDGRTNKSQEVGASLFPVAQVAAPLSGAAEVVPDVFYAEGQGSSVSFVGCVGLTGGATELVRVDSTGTILATAANAQVPCNVNSSFSSAVVGGVRWMLTPGVGAMAFDSSLNCQSVAGWTDPAGGSVQTLPAELMGVGPDGDAMVWIEGGPNAQGLGGYDLWRVSHTQGCGNDTTLWAVSEPGGEGAPVVSGGYVWHIVRADQMDGAHSALQVCHTPYDNPDTDAGVPTQRVCVQLFPITVPAGQSFPTYYPTLSDNGVMVYVPEQTPDGAHFQVIASPTTATNTNLWASGPVMGGNPNFALPYANDTLVAAVGVQNVFFLAAGNGVIQNAGGAPVNPGTGLQTEFALTSGTGTDFFLLNGISGQLPSELVGMDGPSNGVLFRYRTASNLFVAMDDSGQVWMRYGPNLAKLYSLAQYRALLGN